MELDVSILVADAAHIDRLTAVELSEATRLNPIEAGSAIDALQVLIDRGPIDLVWVALDLFHTPGGIELAHALRAEPLDTKLILASHHKAPPPVALPGPAAHLRKPYHPPSVLQALERCRRR